MIFEAENVLSKNTYEAMVVTIPKVIEFQHWKGKWRWRHDFYQMEAVFIDSSTPV